MSTTFTSAANIVFSSARTPEMIRSAERNNIIGNCKIANRSNYTRVTFNGDGAAAFLVPAGPYAMRVLSRPTDSLTMFKMIGSNNEALTLALRANELRAMAYGLLAAANWVDSRDTGCRAAERKPRPTSFIDMA